MKRVMMAILVVLAVVAGMGTGFSVRDVTTPGTGDFSDTEGYTGAQFSANSVGWELENVPPQWSTLYGVWGNSSSDVFAVGERGAVLHYNGSGWIPTTSGTTNDLRGIWADSSYIYVVGTSGTIRRCAVGSTTWSGMTSGTTAQLNGVWGDSSYIYVVGESGTIRRCAVGSTTWSGMTSGTTAQLNGVWGDSSYIYVAGESGTIRRCAVGGTAWSAMTSVTTAQLNGVWGDSSYIYVVGASGTIRRCAVGSTTWNGMTSGTTNTLYGIWGDSFSNVFAVGAAGASQLLHYDGNTWHSEWIFEGYGADLRDIWGTSPSDIFAVGYATILHAWGDDSGIYWNYSMSDSATRNLVSIWGSSSSNAFAIGPLGAVLDYDGNNWSVIASGLALLDDYLYGYEDIWGTSSSDVFVVGYELFLGPHPYIRHYDGSTWTRTTLDIDDELYGVWGSSATDVFAVGGRGGSGSNVILHYNGSEWSPMTSATTNGLYDVWGSSSSDVFAVGYGGTILHYDGSAWSSMIGDTADTLYGVWGSSSSDVFALGHSGTILHYDGSAWSAMSSGTTEDLNSIWGSSASNVFAVGNVGTILHYNGSAWIPMTSGTTNDLRGVWGSSPTDVFAVGNDGTILHYRERIPPGTTTDPVTNAAVDSTTLNGNLTSLGTASSVQVSFEWGPTTSYGNVTATEEKTAAGTFSANLAGLTAKTTYHFRTKAVGDGTVWGDDMAFTTLTVPPSVTTDDASSVAATSATLNGNLTALGTADNVTVSFEYGTTSGGSYTAVAAGWKDSIGTFSVNLASLTAGATYYYRAVADGDGDPVYGVEKSFTTSTLTNQSPSQPSNASPVDAAANVSVTPTLQSSAFSDPDAGDTHAASQWQITSVSGDYSNPLFDSSVDGEHLTQIEILSGVLSSNTYYWHVRHQDNHGTWSEWSAETSFTTLNREPDQPANMLPANGATSASRTSALESSAFSDPDSGDVHIASQWQVSSTSGDYSAPVFDSDIDAGHLTSIGVPSGVLQYSATYYWHVRHQDSHGAWSDWSVETSFTTAPQPQAEFSVTAVRASGGVMLVFFSNLSSGGAPPLTYAWDFDNDGIIDATEREPWYRYGASGTYTVSLTVTDVWGETDTEVKPNCVTIMPPGGGKAETADGQISTEFPSGAVTGTAVVTIKTTATSLVPGSPQGFKIGDTCFIIMALDEDGNEIVTLSQPSVITVKYSEADLAAAGGNPKRLVLAYWDEAAGQWKALKTSVDAANMTLSASTTHLSTWAVMGKTTSASNGLPPWIWLVIGIAAVLAAGTGIYLVAKKTARK
jgi:hypothetical protein